jgi:hypothetical protein
MKRAWIVLSVALLMAGVAVGQTPPATKAPVTVNPIVDIQGKIVSLKMMPGQGMPVMEVDALRARPIPVWLGSMRYLMEQKFSPKVGDQVKVQGYSIRNQNQEEEIVAIQVKLGDQVLKLRDENGWPAWRGGPGLGMGPGAGRYGGNCDHPCASRQAARP